MKSGKYYWACQQFKETKKHIKLVAISKVSFEQHKQRLSGKPWHQRVNSISYFCFNPLLPEPHALLLLCWVPISASALSSSKVVSLDISKATAVIYSKHYRLDRLCVCVCVCVYTRTYAHVLYSLSWLDSLQLTCKNQEFRLLFCLLPHTRWAVQT